MFTCPMCRKALPRLEKECPSCRSDLGLLIDYTGHLGTGLERAEEKTRAGKLGEAVWEYLQVLEVDPDNPVARQQVGLVVTAVRQFDREAPGRRLLSKTRRRERLRRWFDSTFRDGESLRWLTVVLLAALVVISLVAGIWLGSYFAVNGNPPPQ
jgi:hypothetical protein